MSNLFVCLIIVLIHCLSFINAGISLSLSTASGIAAINPGNLELRHQFHHNHNLINYYYIST